MASGLPAIGRASCVHTSPETSVATRCQNRTARRLGHLAQTLVRSCHVRLAANAFRTGAPDQAAEDVCETTALAKYTAAVAPLTGCPICLNATKRASLGTVVVAGENVVVGGAYCASPGGAFLD